MTDESHIFDDEEAALVDGACPDCGGPRYYAPCWNGCDEGYFDGHEQDPLWYDPGDLVPCDVCRAEGGFTFCPACETRERIQDRRLELAEGAD